MAGLALALLAWSAQPTQAQGLIVVNTTADEQTTDGKCSLREAIVNDDARTSPDCRTGDGEDTIVFFVAPSSTLGSELPTVTDADRLSIEGGRAAPTVSGNDAVRVLSVSGGAELALRNLTVADGNAFNGGGISNSGTLEVSNSTFSQNNGGGVVNNRGTVTVSNSTISENSASQGGGIDNNFGPATLRNTIVANSPSGRNCGNDNPINDGGYNIDDGATRGFREANNSQPSTDSLLNPRGLQNNGGPTQTIALQPTSPAIDAIPPQTNGCGEEIRTDQRGVRRPQGSGCDIGAFERRRFEPTGGGGG